MPLPSKDKRVASFLWGHSKTRPPCQQPEAGKGPCELWRSLQDELFKHATTKGTVRREGRWWGGCFVSFKVRMQLFHQSVAVWPSQSYSPAKSSKYLSTTDCGQSNHLLWGMQSHTHTHTHTYKGMHVSCYLEALRLVQGRNANIRK